MKNVFDMDYDIDRIISAIKIEAGETFASKDTLLIFDEIQTCPRALTSLKYFCEEAPDYFIAAAGWMLGISLTEGSSFPVGKVQILYLKPCSFKEFLATTAPMLNKYIEKIPLEPIPEAFADKLGNYLPVNRQVG